MAPLKNMTGKQLEKMLASAKAELNGKNIEAATLKSKEKKIQIDDGISIC